MPKVIHVTPNEDYSLIIEFDNSHEIVYNMKDRLQSTRFCQLTDINRFRAVRVEHGNILVWNSLCQITIDEILSIMEE